MAADTFSRVVALLPQLTADELKQVKQRINALGSLGGGATARLDEPADDDASWVLNVVCTTMRKLGQPYGVQQLRAMPQTMAQLRKRTGPLMAYLNQVDGPCREGFLAMAVEMLAANITALHIPCTTPIVIKHLDRIPALVERQFPGYAKMGLLKFIIRMEDRRGRD